MTDEQLNIAIAEHFGWTGVRKVGTFRLDPLVGKCPRAIYPGEGFERVPNYANDLNAMHEAEKIFDYEHAGVYADDLCEVVDNDNFERENPLPRCFAAYHATARQRAEAFLRTVGKWEEQA